MPESQAGESALHCRAWVDPEYKKRLLKDGATAAAELGISSEGWPPNGGVTGDAQRHMKLTWLIPAFAMFAELLLFMSTRL